MNKEMQLPVKHLNEFVMKTAILSVLLILIYQYNTAQVKYKDSLQHELLITTKDTSKILVLGQLSKYYSFVQPDSGIYYGQKVVEVSQRINYSYGEALGFYCIAVSLDREGNFAKALQMAFTSLRIAQQLQFNKMYMLCLVHYEIGLLNLLTDNPRLALTDLKLSINYGEQSGKLNEVLYPTFSHIAQVYIDLDKPDSALYYAKKGINSELTPKQFIPFTLGMLGNVFVKIKNYRLAEKYYRSSFQASKQYNSIFIEAISTFHLCTLFNKLGQIDTSIYYAKECLKLSLSHHFQLTAMEASSMLTKCYEAQDKTDSTLKYMKLMLLVKDSAFSQAKIQEFQFIAFDEEQRKQQLEVTAERFKNQIRIYTLLAIFAVFLLLAFILYRNNRQKLQLQKVQSEKKQEELQHKATDLEMQALRAQMNPHFIFNCLSSINRFILKNEIESASDYLTKFSRLIRMVLNNSKKELITLDDELEMLRLYLEMERMRFKYSFNYNISFKNEIDPENIFIPPLLLQPFAENAIWHGLLNREDQGHLTVLLNKENNILSCIIEDNGVGRAKAAELKSKSAERNKSLGLQITKQRLALLNKDSNETTFFKVEDLYDDKGFANGTRVILKIKLFENLEEHSLIS